MKLSVIIPAFNEGKYIAHCIASIRQAIQVNQARVNSYEIIVTDNNSTDDTAKRAHQAGAQVVFEPINQISRARNTGAREVLSAITLADEPPVAHVFSMDSSIHA